MYRKESVCRRGHDQSILLPTLYTDAIHKRLFDSKCNIYYR